MRRMKLMTRGISSAATVTTIIKITFSGGLKIKFGFGVEK